MIVNGEQCQQVAISERGFNFGDGHFTTIKLAAGRALLLNLHIQRLQQACAVLAIEFSDWQALTDMIRQQAELLQQGVLKVTITRGSGGRGYSVQGCGAANWYLQHRAIPAHYQQWADTGIVLTVCRYQQTVNPILAGLKTLNRLDQVMLKQELDANDAVDGLVCSTEGYVIETSVANLFWVKDGELYTPSTKRSGVEGIMKCHVLTLLKVLKISVHTGDYVVAQVLAADEVFITNAVMELVPIQAIVSSEEQGECRYTRQDQTLSVCRRLQAQISVGYE
jgi:4-amino-4-deoxychorismate lyase